MSELRTGVPITISGLTIIPVERTSVHSGAWKRSFWVYGSKEPVALVLRYPHGAEAVDMEGREVELADLIDTVDGLRTILER